MAKAIGACTGLNRIDQSAIETVKSCIEIVGKYAEELAMSLYTTSEDTTAKDIKVRLDIEYTNNPLRMFVDEMKYLKTRSQRLLNS